MVLPLIDLRLVEVTSPDAPLALQLAAALCGRLACDLGATVYRVERPGDGLRALPPRYDKTSATHAFLNAGKVLLRCDAADEAEFLTSLIAGADAVVLDERLQGACAADLREKHHAVLAMAGDTQTQHSEFTVEALSGLLDIIGDPMREPLRLAGHQLAYAAGLSAFTGLAAALCSPPGAGPAECVRVELLEVAIWLNWKSVATMSHDGVAPTRQGDAAEWLVLRCADGFMVLVYQPADWAGLQEVAGDPRLDDACFQSPAGRRQHALALNAILAETFAGRTRADIRDIALSRRLPIGAVWSPGELLSDAQMIARQFFRTITFEGQEATVPRLPVLWNGAAPGSAEAREAVP